jgi:hypothetical protein
MNTSVFDVIEDDSTNHLFVKQCSIREGVGLMRKLVSLMFIFSIVLPTFAVFTPKACASENVIFQDDFESYAVGTFPSLGGWSIVWNGAGDQYQVITDSYFHSPTRSLQLMGSYGWSVVVKKDFSTSSNILGYEAAIMSSDPSGPQSAYIGFLNEPIQQWGRNFATISIGSGHIVSAGIDLMIAEANTWYRAKVILDRTSRHYNVWINGVLVGNDLVEPNDPYEILSFQLANGWQSTPCFFDDVKVFEVSGTPPPTGPVITSVSTIAATNLQTIYIYGSGFGNTWPQTVPAYDSDGSVDTVVSSTTPCMCIANLGLYPDAWAAGVQNASNGVHCAIGIYLTSWSDTEIVLGGFGSALNTNGQGPWNIASGDTLDVAVFTASGEAHYRTAVAGASPPWGTLTASPSSQKVVPGGGTAYTISLDSQSIAASLSFSALTTGVTGYLIPREVGGVNDPSTSTLFVSTSTSTPSGSVTIIIMATPGTSDPSKPPISTQVTLEVMGGITIAVIDAESWPNEKSIIGAKVIVDSLSGVTGASGTLTFPSLSTGNHDVTVSAKGYSGEPDTNHESPGVYGDRYIEVGTTFKAYLYPLRYTLTIHVRDQLGNPVDGAQGTIYDSNGKIYGEFATPSWGDLTLIDRPVMTGMTMIVSKYGYQSATASYDITSDITVNIVMNKQQTPGSSLTVRVEDAQKGVAISGATVLTGGQSGITDRLGNAQFSLPPQEYIVTVSKVGYATAYARITLSSNHPATTIKVLLTPQVYGLFVHVQDSQGSPISSAAVTIPGVPGQFTDNGGDAVLTGLKSGSYRVTVSKNGYISSSMSTNVGSSSVRITITLGAVNVPDFSISVSPSYESVRPGSSASFSITLISINGFSEGVELSLGGVTISGTTMSFSPSRVQLSSGGTAYSTLTISTTSTAIPNSFGLNVQGLYAGSLYGSIIHSCPITLKIELSQYKVSITHKSSSNELVCYLFQTATFNVEVTDASSGQYVDPPNYGASFDGISRSLNHLSTGNFAYTTDPFTAKQSGSHAFTFTCSNPGLQQIATDTISVKLHKNAIKLVFSAQEQYYPVDSLFFDDDNVSNNFADYVAGKRPNTVKAYYLLGEDTTDSYVVEYWIYYAYNQYNLFGFPDNHEHDFECIYVWVNKAGHKISKMVLSQHFWTNKYEKNIPDTIYLAVEKGGHGMILVIAKSIVSTNEAYDFIKPDNAWLNPRGLIFDGVFDLTSAMLDLEPAFYYSAGSPVQGFGSAGVYTSGLNYDCFFPLVFEVGSWTLTGFELGGVPGAVLSGTGGMLWAAFTIPDVYNFKLLKSNNPFYIQTLTSRIEFRIRVPWDRPECVNPNILDKKMGFGVVDPKQVFKFALKIGATNVLRFMGEVVSKTEEVMGRLGILVVDPMDTTLTDSMGRTVGIVNGDLTNEIPGARILSFSPDLEVVLLLDATDNYTLVLRSPINGNYTFAFSMMYLDGTEVDFNASSIPVEKASVHCYCYDWNALAGGEQGTTVLVDQFGTGSYEAIHVGSTLAGEEFASLTGLSRQPPETTLSLTDPELFRGDSVFVTSTTEFILSPISERLYQQADGVFFASTTSSDVNGTFYRIHNSIFDSGWQNYTDPFCLYRLKNGNYTIEYYSTDNAGNTELTNIVTVILDNSAPTTSLIIGDPKYISGTTYVTPDTPFTLVATDMGSGVKSTAYRITNSAGYDSGWLTYTKPFNLTSLRDGNYTIGFNSTDNVGNVEQSKTVDVTLARAKWLKQDALNQLNSLLPTGNKNVDGKIMEAAGKIKQSLGTTPWIDENHPNPKYGKQVFDKEKEAVLELLEVLRGTDAAQAVKNKIKAVIDELVRADKEIAVIAIFDAKAKGSTDCRVIHEIKEADEEYSEALNAIIKGNYDRAVEEFGHAWIRAQHAMKKQFGDVNADCRVNLIDCIIVANAFGSCPGQRNWNLMADLNGDNKIDMRDCLIVCVNLWNVYD